MAINDNEKISIVVPIYNSEMYIAECIESIIAQDYFNWELILVDDGSNDSSYNICSKYAKNDKRITVIKQENSGVSKARNTGIALASGKYLTFIDSDDFVASNYCTLLISRIQPLLGMVVLGLQKVFDNGKSYAIKHRLKSKVYTFEELIPIIIDDGTLSGFTFHSSCSVLFETAIIKDKNIRFNNRVKYNEDGLFTTEYFLNSGKGVNIDYDCTPYNYRTNENSATRSADLLSEKYLASLEEVKQVLINYKSFFKSPLIEKQIISREATICLGQIIYLAGQGKLSRKIIKNFLNKKEIERGFFDINPSKLNKGKKFFLYAVRLHCYWIIAIVFNMRFSKRNDK